jgi:hypothetical protein
MAIVALDVRTADKIVELEKMRRGSECFAALAATSDPQNARTPREAGCRSSAQPNQL